MCVRMARGSTLHRHGAERSLMRVFGCLFTIKGERKSAHVSPERTSLSPAQADSDCLRARYMSDFWKGSLTAHHSVAAMGSVPFAA